MEKLLLELQERRCLLERERVNALEHLNCVRGGIAELDLLIEQLTAAEQEKETPCTPE